MEELLKNLDINNLPFNCKIEDFDVSIAMRTAYVNTSIIEMETNTKEVEVPTIILTHIPTGKKMYTYSKAIHTTKQLKELLTQAIDYYKERF